MVGVKFDDRNGNGQFDAGEPTLEDWLIYVDRNGNGQFDAGEPSAISNDAGYQIDDLLPGMHLVHDVGIGQEAPEAIAEVCIR